MYWALIRKDAASDYGVEFPDVPGCYSAGKDLQEAQQEAAEALQLQLEGLAAEGLGMPKARSLKEMERILKRGGYGEGFVALVPVDATSGPANRSVRLNITLDAALVSKVETAG
jgi:predicted RNase H-like HicB family nuclease